MKEYYYSLDGQTVDGPHSEGEMGELLKSGVLESTTLACAAGEKAWVPVSSLQFSSNPVELKVVPSASPALDQETSIDHAAVVAAGNDKDDDDDAAPKQDQAEEKEKERGKYQLNQSRSGRP